MSHADMNNCCGFNEAAASFSWNSPKKAINPYLDPVEVAPVEAPTQIIIQTQPGQSAQDIAREVARQLDERERRLKAKARS
ncbi:hypothetical protein ACM5X3_002112, partial [Escherichia coli]